MAFGFAVLGFAFIFGAFTTHDVPSAFLLMIGILDLILAASFFRNALRQKS